MTIYRCILLIWLAASTVTASSPYSGWSQTPNTQYHIQTDEGPERYFRYQTESGQYRKEKRLQDGTVIGSYGWVDADGYLRLRDYIADNAGYRILKSKTIFVGQDQSIENAVKSAKNVPAQAGILVDNEAHQSPASTPRPHTAYSVHTSPAPSPSVYVSPNSIDVTDKPVYDFRPTVAPISASSIPDYPFNATYATLTFPSSTYLPSTHEVSTPSSVFELPRTDAHVVTITPNSIHNRYKSRYDTDYTKRNNFRNGGATNLIGSESRVDYYNPNSYRHADEYNNRRRLEAMARRRSGQGGYSQNQLGNGYDRQFALYDGVSTTNNGFRYYLPKQYHEEENSGSETRTGSFGYVDPFGIRRVIYYNTSPGSGFQHRKNNRYVGHEATPYDPRPT